jgi:hypothetical protein
VPYSRRSSDVEVLMCCILGGSSGGAHALGLLYSTSTWNGQASKQKACTGGRHKSPFDTMKEASTGTRHPLHLCLYQSRTRSMSYSIVYHRIPRHACMHAPVESLPVSSCAVRDRRLLVSSEAVARPLMARQARVSSRLQHSPPRRHPLLGLPLTGFL